MPLTDTAVRNAKPVRMFDAGGLCLEVTPSASRRKAIA